MDAAGPGRQASRTCPSARPARGGPGGRCAPPATARDPHLDRHPPPYRRLARPRPAHPGTRRHRPAGCCRRTGGGRDTGLTARPEQSGGGSGRTDRHRRRHAPLAAPPPPPRRTNRPAAPDALLTIDEVIAQLRVSRAAFYRWRRRGTGPAEVRLPGGGVRIRRSALREWLRRLETTGRRTPPHEQLRRQVLGAPGRSATPPGAAGGSAGPSPAASTTGPSPPGRSLTGSSPT